VTDPFAKIRWTPAPGDGLTFDDRYRLAQLPLIAPGHHRALRSTRGLDYLDGRYERARISLVADLGVDLLEHETHRELLRRLSQGSLHPKVAWGLQERRSPTLHATLFGDVDPSEDQLAAVRELATGAATLHPILYGPFVGTINRGRLYLPFVFDRQEDKDLLARLGQALGREPQQFIAVGVVNFSDELDAKEAAELAALIDDMRGPGRRQRIERISWTSTHDDLTLDSKHLESFQLQN
jgi:hypothetical protein